jgi:hypothetical protein
MLAISELDILDHLISATDVAPIRTTYRQSSRETEK